MIISCQFLGLRLAQKGEESKLTAVEMVIPRAFSSGALSVRQNERVRV
jgi:hypothetical protein